MKDLIRNILITLDYLFWLLFDFSKFKLIKKETIKKVLIIHSGAIGELLVSTPIIKNIKKQLNAEVHFLLSPGKEFVFKGNPNLDKTFYLGSFKQNLSLMKKEKYDLAIILWPGSLKMSFAAFLAGVRYRVGCFKMVKEGPAFFYTRRWFPLKGNNQHAILSNVDMLKLIGLEDNNPKIDFFFTKEDEKKVQTYLKKNKVSKYLVVHPGFGGKNKHKSYSRYWPEDTYAHLIDYILSKHNFKAIITGIKEESSIAQKIISKSKNKKKIIDSCGNFSFHELAILTKGAQMLIAPDTSIVHLTSIYGTKIIDLIGDSSLALWHPWMKKELYRLIRHPYFDKTQLETKDFLEKEEEIRKAIDSLLPDTF